MDRLSDADRDEYEERPPNEASAAAAVSALHAELELADGNLDALDRKSALLPAFLAALAGLFISSESVLNGLGLGAVVIALVAGILSGSFALYAMRARAHILGRRLQMQRLPTRSPKRSTLRHRWPCSRRAG